MNSRLTHWLRKNVKWKHLTSYYHSTLLYITTTEYGRLYCKGDKRYLVNSEGEIGQIPLYVAMEVQGTHVMTAQWGPYKFYNGIESTAQVHYIKDMFRYPTLTEAAQKKVTDVFFDNELWIQTDIEFVTILAIREEAIRNAR